MLNISNPTLWLSMGHPVQRICMVLLQDFINVNAIFSWNKLRGFLCLVGEDLLLVAFFTLVLEGCEFKFCEHVKHAYFLFLFCKAKHFTKQVFCSWRSWTLPTKFNWGVFNALRIHLSPWYKLKQNKQSNKRSWSKPSQGRQGRPKHEEPTKIKKGEK